MDWSKIKTKARELARPNLWNYWKLMIYIIVITFIISFFVGLMPIRYEISTFISSLLGQLATAPLCVGLYWCLLCIVRNGEYVLSDFFKYFKYCWFILLLQLIVSIFTWVGLALLIVPGIIIALGCSMIFYIFADGESKPMECIRKSMLLMKGYKWDYFVFSLTFLGWFILSILTLGILLIWVIPYYQLSITIYYDELVKSAEN